jgi:hypothetical protein
MPRRILRFSEIIFNLTNFSRSVGLQKLVTIFLKSQSRCDIKIAMMRLVLLQFSNPTILAYLSRSFTPDADADLNQNLQ